MADIVKLSVHKNTLAKRKAADMRKLAIAALKGLLRECDPAAIALVVIDKEENALTFSAEGDFSPSQFEVLLRGGIKAILSNEDLTLNEGEEET